MKSHLHFIRENLVYSNIFVAFCVLSLYKVSEILLVIPANIDISIFIFFSTLTAYNLSKVPILYKTKYSSGLVKWIISNKKIFAFITILSACICTIYIFLLNIFFISLPIIIISLFYIYSPAQLINFFIRNKKIKMSSLLFFSFRDVPLLKIFIIAFSWTYLTIIIPVIVHNISFDSNLILNIIVRFLFVLAITIPFDIRDLKFDKVITLPKYLGVKKSKILAYIILLICELIILYMFFENDLFVFNFLSLFITFEISSVFIFYTSINKNNFYFSFYIEGLSIFMFLVVYLSNIYL